MANKNRKEDITSILFRVVFDFNNSFYFHLPGTANNAGAILVLGRDLVVVPKLIHPLPPAISSPETSPERHIEDTWMQVHNHLSTFLGRLLPHAQVVFIWD